MLDASLPQPCDHPALKADPAAWAALPLVGVQRIPADETGPAETLELRNCNAPGCGSTLAKAVQP
jgi:hypothetical protein